MLSLFAYSLFFARPTRSQNPPPLTTSGTSVTAPLVTAAPSIDIAVLRARFTQSVSATERATFLGGVTPETLLQLGTRVVPVDLCLDVVRCYDTLGPWISRNALGAYGPLRARIVVDTLGEVLPLLAEHAAHGLTSDAVSATAPTRKLSRREALLAVHQLAANDEAQAIVAHAVAETHGSEEAKELARISAEARWVREHVSPRVCSDMNLTPAQLDALEQLADTTRAAKTRRRNARQAQQVLRAELAAPCGLLVRELRMLLAAARQRRRSDPTVPALSSPWELKRTRKAARVPATPAQPVTPAPTG